MTSTLTIGDFSRATHLSVKMLRHYHELGLLEPVDVDVDSGYRRYAAEQIVTAQIIRRFRDLEMPLEDIHAVLQAPDVETRNRVIANHLARGVLVPGVRGNALGSGSGGRPVLRAESRRWHAPPRSRVWCPGPGGRGLTAVESRPLSAGPTGRRANRRGQGDRLREDVLTVAISTVEAQGLRRLSLRGIARQVGIAAPSVYLHFPDLDLLLAAVVEQGFDRLTIATNAAAQDAADTAEELRARCRAYCHFALEHPRLYELMFQADLPLTLRDAPDQTPGRRSFDNLVGAVRRCLDARLAPAHDDPFRLASLIWTAEHGLVLARISRPTFPWASIDALGDDMVTRMMRFHSTGSE